MLVRMRFARFFLLCAGLAVVSTGCDNLRKLRAFFRGEEGATRLTLEVTPASDISISIDGHVVATKGPFEDEAIAPGPHKLSIAAADHYAFAVPIEIKAGVPFKLAVALRRLPRVEATARTKVTRPRERRARTPAEAPSVPLPEGVPAVQLTIAGDPSSAASLDGQPLGSKSFAIDHTAGDFGMGRAEVRFRVGAAGLLELTVPDDGTQWFRDGDPIDPGAPFTFYRGKTRLQQIQPNGETQTIYLAR